jgi:acyl-CoA synthetase (AMP-forming)/AMP-acid ligase II
MFFDVKIGNLIEPLSGRKWDHQLIYQILENRIAHFQSQGLVPGDRVFIFYGNCLEFFVDILAIWRIGGCIVPIDSRLTDFEIETLASSARPRFCLFKGALADSTFTKLSALDIKILVQSETDFTIQGKPKKLNLQNRPSLDNDALILFTSGTTGQPKGVVHTHRSLRAQWLGLRKSLGLKHYLRTLCLLPTHFGHGLICNCLYPWLFGQDLYIVPPFKPDIILQLGKILDNHKITFMSSVPSVWRLALKTSAPPSEKTLKRVFCGSAPLSAYLWNDIKEWTGAGEVMNAYGITETGSWLAGTTVEKIVPEDGLIGIPWGGVINIFKKSKLETLNPLEETCASGESGYVWVTTPALMKGYLGREDLTNEVIHQGWFFTGDIGLIDERSLLYLHGREREEINCGGMKIYPGDVDSVVERFTKAIDMCTFGFEDPLHGQEVGIALVLKETDDATLRELYNFMRGHLAKHQMPMKWFLLEEIPRTSRGKINRDQIANKCSGIKPINLKTILIR